MTLTVLALRELWISFRLLGALAVLFAGGGIVAALPPDLLGGLTVVDGAAAWYAGVEGAAVALVAAMAASAVALDRRRGTAAWLSVRAVPRAGMLVGWFTAWMLVLALGMGLAAATVWLTITGYAELAHDPLPFALAAGAAWAGALTGVALALLVGSLLPPRWATLAALLLVAVPLALVLLDPAGPLGLPLLPTGGYGLLAALTDAQRPIGDALRSAGIALASAAVLLTLAGAVLERAEL